MLLSWLRRTDGLTIISPEGIRLRRNVHWQRLSWGDVASIEAPTPAPGAQTLTITGRRGESLVTSVPSTRGDELIEYARAHGLDDGRAGVGDVVGTYRHRSEWAPLWLALTAAWPVGAGLAAQRGDLRGFVVGAILTAFGVGMWVRLNRLTVVSPAGIRYRRGFRWASLPWNELDAIDRPTRWSGARTLTARTTSGDAVVLAVPASLRGALLDYGRTHGTPRAGSGTAGPEGRDH